jgi:hypothetical protein
MPKKRKLDKGEETSVKDPKLKIKFHMAFMILLVSFLGLTLCSIIVLLILIPIFSNPLLGFILLFILVPLLSGFIAGRRVIKRDTWLLGIMGGLVWSSFEIVLFLLLLFNIDTVMPVEVARAWEILILLLITIANCLFCLFGLRISAKPNALLQIKVTGD